MKSLSISIVSHFSSRADLKHTLDSLAAAVAHAASNGHLSAAHLIVVDNSEAAAEATALHALLGAPELALLNPELIRAPENRGYGAGNNIAINRANSDFHLVLNPDVVLEVQAISHAIEAMTANPRCVLLTPRATDAANVDQHVAKGAPGVLTLLARALPLPPAWRDACGNARYELRTTLTDAAVTGPFLAGGCFMFCRTSALREAGGFDEAYFMYFEDFDLSARLARYGEVLYCPAVRIVHGGGGAARKGLRHILWFSRSAGRFFRQHGWRWTS